MKDFFSNKRILITGVAGTIGSELVKSLWLLDVSVLGIDNAETDLFINRRVARYSNVRVKLCDIGPEVMYKNLCKI